MTNYRWITEDTDLLSIFSDERGKWRAKRGDRVVYSHSAGGGMAYVSAVGDTSYRPGQFARKVKKSLLSTTPIVKHGFKPGDRVRRVSAGNIEPSIQIIKVGEESIVRPTPEGRTADRLYLGHEPHDVAGFIADQFELVEDKAAVNSILDTAKKLIAGSRAEEYGSFSHNAQQQADLWNAYLADGKGGVRKVTPMDVPAMMVLVKLMRLSGNTSHQDSWVDVAGFAGLAEQVHDELVPPKHPGVKKSDIKPGSKFRVLRDDAVRYASSEVQSTFAGEIVTVHHDAVSALSWSRGFDLVAVAWFCKAGGGSRAIALDNLERV